MSKTNIVIFFRKDGFYPVELLDPKKHGKTLESQAFDHAELNPGTLKIECVETKRTLWQLQ